GKVGMSMNCLNCGNELEQKNIGRTRKFCEDKCRIAYFRREKRYTKSKKRETKTVYHQPDKLHTKAITLTEANDFVARFHSHHPPIVGHKFSIGAVIDDALVGVVIVGRPVSRTMDDGYTAEVTRCCTNRTRNAASML